MRELVGFIVLTRENNGDWVDDWDDMVHSSLPDGELALEASRDAGWESILVECRVVSQDQER